MTFNCIKYFKKHITVYKYAQILSMFCELYVTCDYNGKQCGVADFTCAEGPLHPLQKQKNLALTHKTEEN